MSPVSLIYVLLLPLAVLLYYVIPSKGRWIVLLGLSLLFYISWSYLYAILLLGVAGFVYGIGLAIDALEKRGKKKGSTAVFVIALIGILALLFVFKYLDLFLGLGSGLLSLFGVSWHYSLFDQLVLPVGLSFYVFTSTSYLCDVKKGKYPAERHPGYFALYLCFFPTILAGPIERADHLIPQLKAEHRFSWDVMAEGGRYLLLGYFKKLAIADILALYVDSVYGNLSGASGLAILLASLLFAYEIFADFSGYSDIAKGSAALFGISVVENFDQPYRASSSKDFWRRWHISLSTFFRDYVYIPMGGNRVNAFRWAFNILVVFACSGLWHGANWTYLLWGCLFALYQIIGKWTLPLRDRFWKACHCDPNKGGVHLLRVINTFVLVAFAWMMFRANSLSDFAAILSGIFTHYGAGYTTWSMPWYLGLIMGAGCLLTYFLDYLKTPALLGWTSKAPKLTEGLRLASYVVLAYGCVASFIYLYAQATPSTFVYFSF
jgi:alginate O-acetyltransferase complex protein AlgI